MKQLFLLAILLASTLPSFSQANQRRCGTFDIIEYREQMAPGYKQRVNACLDNARHIINQNEASRAANDTVYRIQVVFHVVYGTAAENIPDSVILSQVEVLNEDYRRLNADTVNTRQEFLPVAADTKIEFYLAQTDPDGNPTTGITRTAGNGGIIGFNPFQDNVKSEPGGKAPWPTDRYVNIWVCNVLNGFGILGYAFPPSNAPNWPAGSTTDSALQGIVLHYPVVGRNFSDPIDVTVTRGRSLSHEMGHYLGLRHIWGDSVGCNNDDGIEDTPFASDASQQTCNLSINSCPDAGTDFQDMIENYMDYSDDRCLNMFTQGQADIMRTMLQTSRAGVATIETTTSIKNAAQNFQSVQVFPNPSTGTVYLNAQLKNGGTYTYQVYNAIGEMLAGEYNLSSVYNHRSIDMSAQPAGIYFIKVTSGEQVVVKKVQVTR
ncbi:MAG TPA: M43 family zinc metalloprotease [Chitinophagales bacterium]|nr:M43 family zinc metalloprotease [Chitinophagales bacterium]